MCAGGRSGKGSAFIVPVVLVVIVVALRFVADVVAIAVGCVNRSSHGWLCRPPRAIRN